jgi:hypothetical protein
MPTANAPKQNRNTDHLRHLTAGVFAARVAFARAEGLLAMRMRMHAKQADAAAAAL